MRRRTFRRSFFIVICCGFFAAAIIFCPLPALSNEAGATVCPSSEDENCVSLFAVGDMFPWRIAGDNRADLSPFKGVLPLLLSSDLLFGNLETPLLEGGAPSAGQVIHHMGPPRFSLDLASTTFRVVSLANNHILDYGPRGLDSTIQALDQAGVDSVGVKGRESFTVTTKGITITFLAYSGGYHPFEKVQRDNFPVCLAKIEDMERETGHFAALGHKVVVSLHWGEEDRDTPLEEQRDVAHRLSDAGATLVLGHHPHVLQGIERRGASLIVYSLGNFLWPGTKSHRAESMILQVKISREGASQCEVFPIRLIEGFPSPSSGEERYATLMRILLLSRKLGLDRGQLSVDRLLKNGKKAQPERIDIGPSEWALLSEGTLMVFRRASGGEIIEWQSPRDRYVEKAVTASCFGRERQLVMLVRTLTADKHWEEDHWELAPGPRELTQHIWVTGRSAEGRKWHSLWMSSALDRTLLDMEVSEKGEKVFLSTVELDRSSEPPQQEERLYCWTGWAFQEYEDPLYIKRRYRMVKEILIPSGLRDEALLRAARAIPRHLFVPESERALAYENRILPIGFGQTIPEPSFMARLAQELHLTGAEKVLEIGTGSGYEAALLSRCAREVYTVEIIPGLGKQAEKVWRRLFLDNIHLKIGDGSIGWPEYAPYDAILVTAAPPAIPKILIEQIAEGGSMLIPCGAPESKKILWRVKKENGRLSFEHMGSVIAAPMDITSPHVELVEPPAPRRVRWHRR